MRARRRRSKWRVCGEPHSGKKAAETSSPRGKSDGAEAPGETGRPRVCTDAHAPHPSRPLPLRLCSRRGCERSCLRRAGLQAADDPALGLQRLADPRTGRPPALDAGPPTGLRFPAEGKGFRAPRVSSSHFQPCGSRTRRSCCNQSQDRPIVLARSRFLSPGSARPGRS